MFRTQTYDGTSSHTLLSRYGVGDGSTTFNLPDYRECALVGVGSNGTFTIGNHDPYTLGQFQDDRIQNITGNINGAFGSKDFGEGGAFSGVQNWSIALRSGDACTVKERNLTFDASRVARTGNVTHGKQMGVKYIIKVL